MTIEGKQLGRYHILQLLGSGGMGEVYLAEDPRIKQQVAIKVIRVEQSPYPNSPNAQTVVRLFEREARAIVSLDHPHILPLNDYGEDAQGKTSLVYLVMPYRPEGSLVDWVQRQYPGLLVPPNVVAHIVSQAAEALQHAHDHQITHADVKPANFLIRSNPKTPGYPDVLLSDFGISRLGNATTNASQSIRGTPTYMSPEQCQGEEIPASDQYGLAVMAYELLTGRPPFQGNAMRLMYQHVNTPPEPPSKYNPRLSGAVDEVLLAALSKRPEERFRSMAAFATAFTTAIQQLGMAQGLPRVTNPLLPSITSVLPEVHPASGPMADAPTRITSPGDAVTPPSGPFTPAPSTPSSPQWPAPMTPGWADAPTITSSQPFLETPSSERDSRLNLAGMGAAAGIAGGIGIAGSGFPASAGSAPTMPAMPTASASGMPGVPGAPASPQAGAPAIPSAPAGAQSGAFASQGTGALSGVGKVAAQGVLPKMLGVISTKVIVALLVTVVVATGSVAGVVLAKKSISPPTGPGPAMSATIALTPTSQNVQHTFTLSGVTGTPDASKQQVQARMLSTTTQTYTKTVNATGYVNFPGTHDQGTVIVSNYDPNNPLIFNVGDTISDEGSCPPVPSGQIGPFDLMFDAPVSLPPDPDPSSLNNTPTAYVPGHIVGVGHYTQGCFGADIVGTPFGPYAEVTVDSNFGGGQNPYNGPVVQQSDIDNAAQSLETANKPDPQQVLQPQMQSNEQLVGTPQCTPNVTSDHNAGDQAAQVTVTVTFTCSGEVYDHDGALTLASNLLTQQASTDPGSGYALVGQIKTAVTNATADSQNTVTLTVSANGVWVYQFSADQKQALARMIAGKSTREAQSLLSNQPGVGKVTIQLSGGDGQTLPSDPAKITIVVQSVPGA